MGAAPGPAAPLRRVLPWRRPRAHRAPACRPPLPGLLVPQALPYSWTLFYVPMHFLTHEMLLFFTSIWTTNIHDNIHAKARCCCLQLCCC